MASLREPIPPFRASLRKARVLRTVARPPSGFVSRGTFVAQAGLLCKLASGASPFDAVWSLWRVEGLAYRYFVSGGDVAALLEIPVEARVSAHCGLAMARVAQVGFDGAAVRSEIVEHSVPGYSRFAFESLGAMLGAYDRGFFGATTTLAASFGLLNKPRHRLRSRRAFVAAFEADEQDLIHHGFGRAYCFRSFTLAGALALARESESHFVEPMCRGVLCAYGLINMRDAQQLLVLAREDGPIAGGLFNALTLIAWTFPGCLDRVEAASRDGEVLLARAKESAREARAGGGAARLEARQRTGC